MKNLVGLVSGLCLQLNCLCQATFADTVNIWFNEVKQACHQTRSLWNLDLYAPLLLVDPDTRILYANSPDSAGFLQPEGPIFSGQLPADVNMANTSIEWSGVHWAMVVLPLPESRTSRVHLLSHELFHRAQKLLGFIASNPDNAHLDKKDGRIFLRLEMEALRKAVLAPTQVELKTHVSRALYFRKLRNEAFHGSANAENMLELNEGLAEFTGFMHSGRKSYDARKYFSNRIQSFITANSYTRSFAYETIPVYGFLLNPDKKGWNREIRLSTQLPEFFRAAFGIGDEPARKTQLSQVGRDYSYARILAEETAREQEFLQKTSFFKHLLIDTAHLEIPLVKMNMSFDYTRQFSLDGHGTVYPSIRVTDEWGILEAEEGALINSSWSQVNVSFPQHFQGNQATGQGWTLVLNDGYVLEKEVESGNYHVRKNSE